MNREVTSADALAQKIEEKRYDYYTFPVLEVTIKYRRPDLLKLSLTNSLPSVMAAAVIESYKEALGGANLQEYQEKLKDQKLEPDDNLINDLATKGYTLLQDLCVSHRILKVEYSDPANDVIAWNDIPEEDAMGFLVNLINSIQNVKTNDGGEMSFADITTFPDGKRKPKRSNAGQNG